MAVLRVTTLRPAPEHRTRIDQILDELNTFLSRQPGFILALRFASRDGDEIGRIGLWESEDHADTAAQTQRALALRSEIVGLIGHHPEDEREEALYQVVSTPVPLPPGRR